MKGLFICLALCAPPPAAEPVASITVDYPEPASVFPPDFAPPTFLFRDPTPSAALWRVEISFQDGAAPLRAESRGDRMAIGEIDPRCIAESNKPPALTPQQAAAHTWKPDPALWAEIKRHSVDGPATLTFRGYAGPASSGAVSQGQVAISTSPDSVGAPIFYRDVPLMPTEVEKGVIKPIIPSAVPFIAWRLRCVSEPHGRLLMEGLPTCANCHSFSSDGRTLAMDVDGPQNDKGMYAIAPISPRMAIRDQDVFSWNDFPGKPPGHRTIGFMAQVSPDGRYSVTTVNEDVYVANFKDYGFLQVFYPTRGILAYYDRQTGRIRSLPGADNPNFVQTNAFWSPDGKTLVFARARARDAYPNGRPMASYAGDPLETPIHYDLYRIPFNGGKGGRASPIKGAGENGMSNSFPKVSPDGRWVVFVQSANGQLMRPDGRLWIVPFEGGRARLMRCNTARMNSWHSFSPNGRWMVFSSKSRTPYTQMFLTHIDEDGNDSPPILIEDSTAANRAVNIPEFLNVPPGGLERIDIPAADFYRIFDTAWNLAGQGRYADSIREWNRALELEPRSARAHNNLGHALAGKGDYDEALARWRRALELKPDYPEAENNLAVALLRRGDASAAIPLFEHILAANNAYPEVHANLARALAARGRLDQAAVHWRNAVELKPDYAEAFNDWAVALSGKGRSGEAIAIWRKAIAANPRFAPAFFNLGNALEPQGQPKSALEAWQKGLALQPNYRPALQRAAWVLATSPDATIRDGKTALDLAAKALSQAPDDPALLDTLAAALAETGHYEQAAGTAARAAGLAAAQGDTELSAALTARAALYRSQTPYRTTPH